MITHILKMLWQQKRSYISIFIEQLLVAVVLMLSVVSVTEAVKKYRSPGLMDVRNTFYIGYMFRGGVEQEAMENTQQNMNVILENLRKLSYVEAISSGYNLAPYVRNDFYYYQFSDSIFIDDKRFQAVTKVSDEFGAMVLKPDIEEGRWLENHPLPDNSTPVVITRQFADKAGWTSAIGKKITNKSNVFTVVGMVTGLKQEPFIPAPVAIVVPKYTMPANVMFSENMARIKPNMQKEFFNAYQKEFNRLISDENVEPLINDLQQLKGVWVSYFILDIVLQAIPTAFLFVFAFIGTFGLYWMVSSKRLKEFALRIAVGATPGQLMTIVIGESLFITGIAVIPALLLSFFIYEYTLMHVFAVSITVFIMLLFSLISAWYPAWKVSRVNPAEALQYE